MTIKIYHILQNQKSNSNIKKNNYMVTQTNNILFKYTDRIIFNDNESLNIKKLTSSDKSLESEINNSDKNKDIIQPVNLEINSYLKDIDIESY